MLLTMAAVAAAKDMSSQGFSVCVRLNPPANGANGASFDSEIRLSERFSPREQRILFNAARSCEVHHLLRGPIVFRETLMVEPDIADSLT